MSKHMLKNRLEKNWKKLRPWSEQHRFEAIRLYDRDIPEFQFIIDKYKDYLVIYDKTDAYIDKEKNLIPVVMQAVKDLFQPDEAHLIMKARARQAGLQQYEKLQSTQQFVPIQEGKARLLVNLWDYLDTGLFLDHRPMRERILKEAANKRFLNLFCYTGAVSVAAALGGAKTVSVDMSATYLDWAKSNFKENSLAVEGQHEFIQADVIAWLDQPTVKDPFDLIFLDPPTFSNSKRMDGTFDVERDQENLIEKTMDLLTAEGVLYFSNNKRKFKLSDKIMNDFIVKNMTAETIPRDFHDQKIHQCFSIRKKP
jgi:23S rRNA (cytosine1962-C5)-methyltransferase/23S rRNA (guanine2445-N2)-methyltransferase / 23S rRNA (guanine2069-N7)-methyltransferase